MRALRRAGARNTFIYTRKHPNVYCIHPIRVGTLTSNKDALTLNLDRNVEVTFPVVSFLITPTAPDDDAVVVVDTGVRQWDDDYILRRGKTVGPPGGGPEPLVEGLADAGIAPQDVDTLVLTHCHHDHIANVGLFPDADLVVQHAELEAANDPLPVFAETYPDQDLATVRAAEPTVVDGEHHLREGIDLLPTPGHTEGSQSVLVTTAHGIHALVGDLAYTRHNLDPGLSSIVDAAGECLAVTPVESDYVPPGTVVDVAACYESIRRLRDRIGPDGVILPGHDAELATSYPMGTEST